MCCLGGRTDNTRSGADRVTNVVLTVREFAAQDAKMMCIGLADTDFRGGDINDGALTHAESSVVACAEWCAKNTRCAAWVWDSASNLCYPKVRIELVLPKVGVSAGNKPTGSCMPSFGPKPAQPQPPQSDSSSGSNPTPILVPIAVVLLIAMLLVVAWRVWNRRKAGHQQLQENEGPIAVREAAGLAAAMEAAPGGPMLQMASMRPSLSVNRGSPQIVPALPISAAHPVAAASAIRLDLDESEEGVQREGAEGVSGALAAEPVPEFTDHSATSSLLQPGQQTSDHAVAAPVLRTASESANRVHVELFGVLDSLAMMPLSASQRARVEALSTRVRAVIDELLRMERTVGLTFASVGAASSALPGPALVSAIDADSPASDSDVLLEVGDLLVAVEGVAVRSADHASFLLRRSLLVLPGQTAYLSLLRGGQRVSAAITPMTAGGISDAEVFRRMARLQHDLHALRGVLGECGGR